MNPTTRRPLPASPLSPLLAILTAALLPALLALPAGPAAAQATARARTPAAAPESIVVSGQRDLSSWLRAESPHFVVYSDTRAPDLTRFLVQLERLDTLLRLYTAPFARTTAPGGAMDGTLPKLTLYYLDGTGDFQRFAPGGPAMAMGMVDSCAEGVLGVGVQLEPVAQLADDELATLPLDQGQSYLFEAYARHFLYRYTDVRAPAALIEGMAKYFSALRFSDTQMVVGRTPIGVGRYFGHLDEGHAYLVDYDDVLARTYAQAPQPWDSASTERQKTLEFQARAWALVHYMLSTDERRRRMAGFVDAVHLGAPPAEAFRQSYGIAPRELSGAMWRYRQRDMKALRVALPPTAPPEIVVRPLSQAAGQFVLADALRAGCPANDTGRALLRDVAARAAGLANSDAARTSLARAQVAWGDPGEAAASLPYLEQAAARDANDADAAYWLGRANLRLAGADRTRLQAAGAQLARAGLLRPGAPEIALARLQAALLAAQPPGHAALDAVTTAWQAGRDSNPLARDAALAYAWTGQPQAVLHVLHVLANDSRDPASQAWAASWEARLAHGVAPHDLFAEMGRAPGPEAAVREWTVDQDGVAQEVEHKASRENLRRIIPWQLTDDSPSMLER